MEKENEAASLQESRAGAAEPQESRVKSEESSGAEGSKPQAASPDLIYDLTESSESSHDSEDSENSESSESSEDSENSENSEDLKVLKDLNDLNNAANAETEIQKMVKEVGAETLLQIIRDNRNAAIRQIISEVEASRDRALPSGDSVSRSCTSIFDLAALA